VPPALLAQLVEHLHGKEGVDGSSPSEGSGISQNPRKTGIFVVQSRAEFTRPTPRTARPQSRWSCGALAPASMPGCDRLVHLKLLFSTARPSYGGRAPVASARSPVGTQTTLGKRFLSRSGRTRCNRASRCTPAATLPPKSLARNPWWCSLSTIVFAGTRPLVFRPRRPAARSPRRGGTTPLRLPRRGARWRGRVGREQRPPGGPRSRRRTRAAQRRAGAPPGGW
jgi:hypothetical protein